MQAQHLKGLPVIGIAEGKTLGTVSSVYVDAEARSAIGFFIEGAGNALGAPSAFLDCSQIRGIGSDAVTVNDHNMIRGEAVTARIAALVTTDALLKRPVLTEDGRKLGTVANIELEPPDCRFTHIEVSQGLLKSNTRIPIEQVLNIGPELIVVANTADERGTESVEEPDDTSEARVTTGRE